MASKLRFRDHLVGGENCILVEDPSDHSQLGAFMRFYLSDLGALDAVAQAGLALSAHFKRGADGTARAIEDALARLASQAAL